MTKNEQSPIDAYHLFVKMIQAISPDHTIIEQASLSVEAIRDKIDQAYNRICMDLPDINMEIHQTFQQASSTLDSLYAQGTKGMIENVVGEMEGTIRNLAHIIEPMRSQDMQVLEAINLPYPNRKNVLCTVEDSLIERIPHRDAKSIVEGLLAERDALAKIIGNALVLENSFIEDTISTLSLDAKSLEYTLSNAILILKDLVSRSNSMKEPILNIMSGLQAHDIVNQDIATISCGLQKMKSLKNISGSEDDILDAILFQEQASSLSGNLISQLITVVRNHGSTLNQEIVRVEDMVSRIKEDKDVVGEFLLTNENGKSTFDIVIFEVSEIFAKVTEKFESLIVIKVSQQAHMNRLVSLCNDFDQHISSDTSIIDMNREDLETISKMTFLYKTLGKMISFGYGSLDLKENLVEFGKEADAVKNKLGEIKALLIESIKGIDIYSRRCIDAITRFKLDIDKLIKILDGNENVFDGLNNFARSMASIRDDIFRQMSSDRGEIFTKEFKDIIFRLKNPHSDSLSSEKDHELDEGLVLF